MSEHEYQEIIWMLLRYIGVTDTQRKTFRRNKDWICEFISCYDIQCHECPYKALEQKIYEVANNEND